MFHPDPRDLNAIRETCEFLIGQGLMGTKEIAKLFSEMGFPILDESPDSVFSEQHVYFTGIVDNTIVLGLLNGKTSIELSKEWALGLGNELIGLSQKVSQS